MLKKKRKGQDDPLLRALAAIQAPDFEERHKKRQRTEEAEPPPRPISVSKAVKPGVESGPYMKTRAALPIWEHQDDIRAALRGGNGTGEVLIIVGEPGSGKSTQVPQFLRKETWCSGMIAITEPRRVAAVTLAHRVAREVGTPLGQGPPKGEVGYSVRFEHNVPRGTKIKFLTEGMLLQELLRDPGLRQYSAVVVDEIHERSVDADLLLGFLKRLLARKVPERKGAPLKVVVMSATADVEKLRDFFEEESDGPSVQVLEIPGRQHPVEIIHTPEPVPVVRDALVETILDIHQREGFPGDILAFLEGQEEIEAAQSLIEEAAAKLGSDVPKVAVFPLYGQQSTDVQHKAFQPVGQSFTRKVVLATNIAETSVTVPGVKYVVDCGKVKVKQFRPKLGMESLLKKAISKSSAIQRAGRAGREAPGKCFRLYTEETYNDLREVDIPEILRANTLGAVLTMKARGIQDIFSFPLMDPPDPEALRQAHVELWRLGALADDENFTITEAGRKMSQFPVPAPLARVLVAAAAAEYDCLLEAIDIVSCITTGYEIFQQLQTEAAREEAEEHRRLLHRREGDLLTYLVTMRYYAAENADRTTWCRQRRINGRNMRQALNIRRQLRGMCVQNGMLAEAPPRDPQPYEAVSPERAETIVRCFLEGLFHSTALLAPDGSYQTSEGRQTVAVHPSSVLHGVKKREAIMFVESVFTSKQYARKVTAVQADWIANTLRRATGRAADEPGEGPE